MGDYFVIEDVHPYINADTVSRKFEYQTIDTNNVRKEEFLTDFLKDNKHWKLHTYYGNFFGNYSSQNGFAYARKMEDKKEG